MRTSVPPLLERTAAGLLLAGVAFSLTIAGANILLGLAFVVWIPALILHETSVRWRPIYIPALAWTVWSVVSAFASTDPHLSLPRLANLATLLLIPMTVSLLTLPRWHRFLRLIAGVSSLSSLIALVQILVDGVDLEHRASGVFSHYMTFGGWTMTVMLLLVGEALRGDRGRLRWILPVLGLHTLVLSLSLTRNAWVGIAAALGLAAILWGSRALMTAPLALIIALTLLPATVMDRLVSITDMSQPANRDRIAMIEAGAAMTADHPWVGVGPDMVKELYPRYRTPDAVRPRVSHLHCNPVHIAAERGLPALAAYVMMLVLFVVSVVGTRDESLAGPMASCLLAVVGLTTAGLFEYNWGDAEIWILTLFILTVPTALRYRETSREPVPQGVAG